MEKVEIEEQTLDTVHNFENEGGAVSSKFPRSCEADSKNVWSGVRETFSTLKEIFTLVCIKLWKRSCSACAEWQKSKEK